jgi:hypothetical protein
MHSRTLDYEILSQTMDLELIRTLAFYTTKNLVISDSRTYHTRCLGLSPSVWFSPDQEVSKHNLFQMFKDGRYSPPRSPILIGNGIYRSTPAAKPTCIYKIIRGRFRYRPNFTRRRIWRKTWMHANKALCLFELLLLL